MMNQAPTERGPAHSTSAWAVNSSNYFSVFGPGKTLWASARGPQGEAAGKELPFRPRHQGGMGQGEAQRPPSESTPSRDP